MSKNTAHNWHDLIGGTAGQAASVTESDFLDAQITLATPRRMMTQLRGIMQGQATSGEKLDQIVELIAKELKADVCACYVMRAGDLLELFSATGEVASLRRSARVYVGEGLVGEIAADATPLLVSDTSAIDAPVSALATETGNGQLRSFCGVPILYGSRVRGVLTIQNKIRRSFGNEVVEIMQTVGMVLAELIVGGGVISRQEINSGFASGGKPTQVDGISLGRGLAIGHAVLYEPELSFQEIMTDDVRLQKQRLRHAANAMHAAIDRMLEKSAVNQSQESRDILEAYQMFARDRGWLMRIEDTIAKGITAEGAVQRVLNETRARMAQMNDPYIRERLQDLEDISNRLLTHLMRQSKPVTEDILPDDIILVARSLGPAALLDYDHKKLKAVVLEKGSHSNHVAIIARSLGIPVVGQCKGVLETIARNDQMIVDGDRGTVYVRPSQYVVDLYTKSLESRAYRSKLYKTQQREKPCETQDGKKIAVMMNAGLISELDMLAMSGADGIGLFRTELSFMSLDKYPLVSKQTEFYGKIMDMAGDKPVVFRTLDIGGDKPLPYFTPPQEEDNPALGWRAVRIGMDRPAVLRTQFRAFIRAAKGRPVKIMLPLVTEVAEYDRARQLLDMEVTRCERRGEVVPEKIDLGVMLEVPALLWQLDVLLKTVDFVSVGTNDLMQYMFAADRGNDLIRNRYDALSPAMLKALKTIARKCNEAGVPVSVCGEMAGQPLEAMVLIGLGFQTLSSSGQAVDAVRMMVPTVNTNVLAPYLDALMESREHSVRTRLLDFARDHGVNIEGDF